MPVTKVNNDIEKVRLAMSRRNRNGMIVPERNGERPVDQRYQEAKYAVADYISLNAVPAAG
jgi:hypothetical protein